MICTAALTACTQKQQTFNSGIDYTNIDTTAQPGNDFAQYATGNWIIKNPRPEAFAKWGSFAKLGDDNTQMINELIQELAGQENETGSAAQKIADLYKLSMDSVRLNAEGATPLKPYIEKINALKTRKEFIDYAASEKDNLFFGIYIGADEKNSAMNIVNLYQGGLSLGDEKYYLGTDEQTTKIREAYKQYIIDLFTLAGYNEKEANKNMQTILKLETEMAKVTVSKVELRIPEKNYHKMTVEELSKMTKFDWNNYFKQYGYEATTEVVIGQPTPIAKGCEILQTASLDDLKTLYIWRTIRGGASLLSDAFTDASFRFNQVLTGAKEQHPRWKRSVNRVDNALSQLVGQIYVKKYFPEENKTRMLELVANLKEALGERIMAQTWMCDETKQVAMEKLATFYVKIGYPDSWDDFSALRIDPALSLYDNMVNIGKFDWQLDKEKHYNKPVDKTEWLMPCQMVNAYYNPTTNEICFPAAILQYPFFSMEADDAANYGAIGVVIGHEMTHGFDDQGRQYDKNGNLAAWWKQEDIDGFQIPAQKLVAHFDSLNVLPDLKANGALCLGENIADHGGIKVAFEALKKSMNKNPLPTDNGFTPEQRFFLAYANVWAGQTTEDMIRYLTTIDVHSIHFLRINGTLPHIDAWYDAFDVKEGDALYIPKEQRVNIW